MEEEKIQGKGHLIFFLVMCAVGLLLGVINLTLPVWVHYCWWDLGLVDAANTSRIVEFDGENSISDVKSDICGDLQSLVERSCPHACENLKNFESAGVTMLAFGAIALFFMFCSLAIPIFRLFKYRVQRFFSILTLLPFLFWLIGFSSYAGAAGLGRLENPTNKPQYNFNADEYSVKVGTAIAITNIFLYLLIAVYGWVKIRKLLQVLK